MIGRVRAGIIAAALAAAVLVAKGVAATPHVIATGRDWLGPIAVMAILILYAAAAFFGAPPSNREALALGARLGLFAGGVYVAEILAEYIWLPADNTALGLIEFGAVFLIFAVAGFAAAVRIGRLRPAVASAVWASLISALIWYLAVLAVLLLFRGSERQVLVLRAEGTFEDMRRSGMTDLDTFVMQDTLGAGFYHLLLSPILATVLGGAGAGVGLLFRRLRPPSPRKLP